MSTVSRLALAAALLALLTACAPGPDRREDDAPFRLAAQKAWRPAVQEATLSFDDTWIIDGRGLDITLVRPARAGPLPVVVYLPGLGESRHAGVQWREAWARAGYAVLSLQTLDDDATAWQSDLARDGEFRALGRHHYAPAMSARRLQVLRAVIDEGRRRQAADGWQGLDWNALALAGYDLGAHAALVAAGERVGPSAAGSASPPQPPSTLPVGVRAVVLISPYADAKAPGADTRYRDIRAPVLSITGDADGDPLGLIATPEQRLIPYQHLSARPAWLLDLHAMPHAALAGNAEYERARYSAAQAEQARSAADEQQRERQRTSRGGGRRGDMGEDRFGPGGSSNRALQAPGSGRDAPALGPQALQWRVDAVRDVSTAFLDATLRGDTRAQAWLAGDAAARLAGVGGLQGR